MSILFLSLPLAGIVLYCTTISAIENIHNNKSCYSNKVFRVNIICIHNFC